MKNFQKGTLSFLVKVVALSAFISLLIKYVGSLIPSAALLLESVNGWIIFIVFAPSILIGTVMLLGNANR